ncbi:MAG: T9SS type A sorting domain-containing protein [Saprospiraceae bacterium]|nr:T9SS type A sorting domain-containing protein [Saprospiraceae bacterium]
MSHRRVYLICPEVTSVNNQSIELFTSIFPNPTSNELYIKSDIEILEVEIINAFGQRTYNATYDNMALDVANLGSGTYILKVQTVNGLEFHKFSVLQ